MAAVIQKPIEDHFQISKENHTIILPQPTISPPPQQQQQQQKGQKKIHDIDPRDVGTPDNWISRHPELIRLTGKHPFNSEASLPSLMKEGFITPTPLHYVRNHGAVPKLDWDTHRLVVKGLVTKPLNLSMDDIVKMPYREFPITLVCAGNRRKEQNMIKQSIGFNWGTSAVSTAIWRGVPLRYILKLAGCSLDADYDEPRHVCFLGADKLPNGYYGTSLTLEWSMNNFKDVLLAYEMNGERLHPDHGFPIRVIIPGVIGGRMVKWLKEITVTNCESDNYYHIYDNRVLPPNIDVERANKEGWWSNPDYVINELNINSVISSPAHDEHIPISSFVSNTEYTIKGYAYTGGGRKVIRVEISFDNGKTWSLTNLNFPEITHPLVLKRSHNPIRRHWCWCFWSLNVPLHSFIGCSEIRVRAVDSSQNIQPENPTWNVMGMMNNCHFKIKIHTVINDREVSLKFEHPTQAGNNPGGWMVKQEEPAVAITTTTKPTPVVVAKGPITMDQVEKHDNEKDCWIVVEKKVYDCTKFLSDHPGGADSILINAGTDCTEEFNAIHSDKAKNMLADYYIGDLVEGGSLSTTSDSSTKIPRSITLNSDQDSLVALNPKIWISCPLIEKKAISHDTRIFRFALQSNNHSLGLPVGNHLFIRASVNDKAVIRAYTPITPSYSQPGFFDLLIKVYFKNVHPKFPNGGIMTQYLESLNIGDKIDVKGPLGSFIYFGRGQYRSKSGATNKKNCKRIGLIAGGSGITPVYQIIQSVLNDPEDHTEISLIYANRNEKDILLRNELDEFAKNNSSQFKIYYTLSNPSSNWKSGVGYITEEMIRKNIPPPLANSQTIVLLCGPVPLLDSCVSNLKKIGFTENEYIEF